jgi:hypothetical protein
MSIITIQCRLVAEEETLGHLWKLMTQKNTPLINELLEQIGNYPELEEWIQQGKLPKKLVETLCDSLETDLRFSGQPGRFKSSAITLVDYIYKSWLALQQRRQRQISGKERWLSMLKSDAELEKDCNSSLDVIRVKATELLTQIVTSSGINHNQPTDSTKGKKTKKGKADKAPRRLFSLLFDTYENTTDSLKRCSLAYLLKNGCQVSEIEEDPEKFAQRRRAKEIEIERLKEQLKSRIPKGRDLTGEQWLEALDTATYNVPKDEDEAKAWQAALLRKSSSVPFPIHYGSSTDWTWFKKGKGRIGVKFNGLAKYPFEIYCDRRQLHWFNRFLEDWKIYHDNEKQYSAGLATLRSARLVWLEGKGKGEPWNVHRLTLHCSVDTRAWTAQGTELVCSKKIAAADKEISNKEQKGDLNEKQPQKLQCKYSERERLKNPFPSRPSKPLYQGQSSILVGVSFGLEKPATVSVVDVAKGKVLAYRNVKQLLGDNYKLLTRQRQQQQSLSHQRHKAQKRGAPNEFGESELGQYVDRLLAKAIVAIAKTYQAGSIVLPKLSHIREILSSEVQARAEQKVPNYKKGQQEYAKQYRVSVHRWSYGRLIESIQSQAAKTGIAIEVGQQSIRGSPQEKARDLALSAYSTRITSVN